MKSLIACVLFWSVFVPTARAEFTLRVEEMPRNIDGVNYSVFDFYLTGPGNVTTMEMLFDAGVPGGIYQNQFGSNIPPSSAIVGAFPDAAFDSFVAVGFMTDGPTPIVPGAAIGIPGSSGVVTFDDRYVDIAWASPGADPLPAQDAFVMRLTLRDDVRGTAQFYHAGQLEAVCLPPWVCFPEPVSSNTLFVGLLGLLPFRRCLVGLRTWTV